MTKVNRNYLKLPGSYLFSEVARRISAYSAANPNAKIIKLSIGDVTRPLVPAVIEAMHKAVDEMGAAETFRGYGPEQGYDFLREAIAQYDYKSRGVDIAPDEIFVSDGAKSDCGNIGDIFGVDNVVDVCDPVYPVYVDTNAMAGRAGDYQEELGRWNKLIYMPCVQANGFSPEIPKEKADLIYVGGGDTVFMIEHWKKTGMLALIEDAYKRGVIIAGLSAGAICWFENIYTDSLKTAEGDKYAMFQGLGWIKNTISPHYAARMLDFDKIVCYNYPVAYGIEDDAALLIEDEQIVGSLSSGGKAYRLESDGKSLKKTVI